MEEQHDFLTCDEFAEMARVTVQALKKWEGKGIGPRPLRPPGSRIVRYRRREVERWLNGEDLDTEAIAG